MKLSGWARQVGVGPRTAYRWFHVGQFLVAARQLATDTILVDPPAGSGPGEVAVSAEVSAAGHRADLDRQATRLALSRVVAEDGSATCGNRPRLRRLLADPEVAAVVAEHRGRLVRFGAECVETARPFKQRHGSGLELAAHGCRLVVVDEGEVIDDLVGNMVEVGASMCARLDERPSARRRAQRAVEATGEAW